MRLSKIISVALHPIFMPLITLQLTLFLIPEIQFIINPYLTFITVSVVISTIIFPLILILIFIKMGRVKSLEMDNYKERSSPLIYCSLSMFIGYQFVDAFLTFTPILKAEFLGAIIIISVASFISKFWKISLHMLAIGGLTGALIGLHFLYGGLSSFVIVAILLAGVLGISRINENAHNYSQIYTGFLIGVSIELATILLF
ncbi:MAG: hypothetical protein CMD16_03290 [Flavobacteriales bacterium]|nr:hypothetical protein [Flavobacteriales bacterium]|tara:strand:+ start:1127 stop:1729 length:603 start_codon:yes stop_codon:yes gene_type:complete